MWARRKDLSKETPQTLAEVHEKALLRQLVIEDESQHSTNVFTKIVELSVPEEHKIASTRCFHPVLLQSSSCF